MSQPERIVVCSICWTAAPVQTLCHEGVEYVRASRLEQADSLADAVEQVEAARTQFLTDGTEEQANVLYAAEKALDTALASYRAAGEPEERQAQFLREHEARMEKVDEAIDETRRAAGGAMSGYTAHLARDEKPDYTACGEPWQGWQAPRTDSYELTPGNVELPPHDEPRPHRDQIRQCQACLRAALSRPRPAREEEQG